MWCRQKLLMKNWMQEILQKYSGLWCGKYKNVDKTLKQMREEMEKAGLDKALQEANKALK